MDDKTATAAAAIMYQHLHQGSVLEGLQDNLRPQSRTEGYQIQARLEDAMDSQRKGWKLPPPVSLARNISALTGRLPGA